MAKIVIVSGIGCFGVRLSQVAEVLRSRGHEVKVVTAGLPPEPEIVKIVPLPVDVHDFESAMFSRKGRDYPTLREGLRRKQIKTLRR